ncbi:MAG: hypothetical protein KatS3mg002_0125 [Candidatus Woesearchaeota archaeon]|nr:MAG: hypothetical protein KatS3mg002_0125 [Candidatus Woesearchaeota archaeon]
MKAKSIINKILNRKGMNSWWHNYRRGDIDKKISYLDNILERESLLKEETRKAVYEVLGDLAFCYDNVQWDKPGMTYPALAEEYYKRAGLEDKIVDMHKKIKKFNEEGDMYLKEYLNRGGSKGYGFSGHCDDLISALGRYRAAGNKEAIRRIAYIDLRDEREDCAREELEEISKAFDFESKYLASLKKRSKEAK